MEDKFLLITCAGQATRFKESGGNTHKSIFSIDGDICKSPLGIMCQYAKFIERTPVIVTGFMTDEIDDALSELSSKLEIRIYSTYNEHYSDLGSNESLICGLQFIMQNFDYDDYDIMFAEGDLMVDFDTFREIANSQNCVVTTNGNSIINMNKAVVVYQNVHGTYKWAYDLAHKSVSITDARWLAESGQIWKFKISDYDLFVILDGLIAKDHKDTNLNMIYKIFATLSEFSDIDIKTFKQWFNVNTVNDYKLAIQSLYEN